VSARLSAIGKEWQTRIKRFFDSPLDADAKPLEICQAALDEIESRVQPVGRGRRVFPYNRVIVRVRPAGADRAALEACFAALPARVHERLAELQCATIGALDIKVTFLKKAPPDWPPEQLFAVDGHADAAVPSTGGEGPRTPSLHVLVLKGAASDESYTFTEPTVSIGRTPEPTDDRGHVRRNRVAFLDVIDGVTETVGRAHARLRFEPGTGEYRLYDEGSSNGTSIVRDGAAIPVPARDPRGVRVKSGDEVQIGRAVIRVEFELSR
jgi:pSer/pThr/pTyr-binding forkhead associated (FHA) protein